MSLNIKFNTLRSVCKYQESGYGQWNEDWTKVEQHYCCVHKDNKEYECLRKHCPLKGVKKV